MKSVLELCELLLGCILEFKILYFQQFVWTLVVAFFLSMLGWFVCARWTYLWHKDFHARAIHQALCALAALFAFCFAVLYPSLSMLQIVARLQVAHWAMMLDAAAGEHAILSPTDQERARQWSAETFITARHFTFQIQKRGAGVAKFDPHDWETVYSLSEHGSFSVDTLRSLARTNGWTLDPDELHTRELEPFAAYHIPGSDQGPLDQKDAEVYVNAANALFQEIDPVLSWIIRPDQGKVPQALIQKDMADAKRDRPDETYAMTRATNIARKQIDQGFEQQLPRVVTVARACLVTLFFLALAIPFGLIGWAAYSDLRAHRRLGAAGARSVRSSATTS